MKTYAFLLHKLDISQKYITLFQYSVNEYLRVDRISMLEIGVINDQDKITRLFI